MTDEQLDEIVAMLRACHADAVESDGDYCADQFSFRGGGEAADAIEWLRREVLRLRLTDDEEEAIRAALEWLLWCEQNHQIGDGGRKDIAALRGMLNRTNHDAAPAAKAGAEHPMSLGAAQSSSESDAQHPSATTLPQPGGGHGTGDTFSPIAKRGTDSPQPVASTPQTPCTPSEGTSGTNRIVCDTKNVGPAPVEGQRAASVTDVGGAGPTLRNCSLGGREMEPVAWRAYDTDGSEAVYLQHAEANAAAYELNWSVEPLYRKPMLEADERAALLGLACYLDTRGSIQLQAWGSLLRILLARLS